MRNKTSATFLLRVPEQDLKDLQITSSNSKQFASWLKQLPKGHVGETARQLYLCIQELNRVELTPKKRFYLLEAIRPNILHVCRLLEKHYLNQSLNLSGKARKVANLSLALQNHLITGYKIVTLHGHSKVSDKEYSKIATTAIHRALNISAKMLVQTYQLYNPVGINTWHEIYQLYRIAEYYKLTHYNIEDSDLNVYGEKKSSINHAFCRCLLLATARPNQLRQQEIAKLFDALDLWSRYASIELDEEPPCTFSFDLLGDSPPNYLNWVATDSNTQLRVLVIKNLVRCLEEYLKKPSDPAITGYIDPPFQVSDNLSKHLLVELIDAWSQSLDRTFNRTAHQEVLDVCIGLKATHYYVADEMEFSDMINDGKADALEQTRENPFLNPDGSPFIHSNAKEVKSGDAWSIAFDGGQSSFSRDGDFNTVDTSNIEGSLKEQKEDKNLANQKEFTIQQCKTIDISPGGYCIEWQGKIPSQVRTGEILGIKENDDTNWNLGVIRWANHTSSNCVRIGIELLSNKAIACGVQLIPKTGESSVYIRALQLPELEASQQDSTFLVPAIVFHPGNKINVNCDGLFFKAQLKEEIASTAAFSLFTFKVLEQQGQKNEGEPGKSGIDSTNDDLFDNIWHKL